VGVTPTHEATRTKTPTQHTAGHWLLRLETQRDYCGHRIISDTGRLIATTDCDDSVDVTPEEEANACLIAAAPDLLEAASEALGYLTDHAIDLDGEEEAILAGIRENLASVIAKATRR